MHGLMKDLVGLLSHNILIFGRYIQQLKKIDKKVAERLDYDGIQFPVQKKRF